MLTAHRHVNRWIRLEGNDFSSAQVPGLTSHAAFGSNQQVLLQEQSSASTSTSPFIIDAPQDSANVIHQACTALLSSEISTLCSRR
jgi:hypothetical protein